ncbi:hypothetical protein DSM107010_58660 [Chroococcidiopsis cubana SAG 39.79]|uniref:NADP-dependent oxidoreductase domain-containing protein n=2 Tax=Chroococcidiopsis TaxID=54298 RepID=A0AB37UBB2_9CYAN|nr:hypothetical protein DSM107010_58660 [Chroococcidiopsis cubana SAG 39.79]
MRLTGQPGKFGAYPDGDSSKQLLQRAVELGVNFIETDEAYGVIKLICSYNSREFMNDRNKSCEC